MGPTLASIRRFKLTVIALAIVGLGTGIGLPASQHSGYQSHSVLMLPQGVDAGVSRHDMFTVLASAPFWRTVASANEVRPRITVQPANPERLFTITATGSTPGQAASTVRTVTRDFADYMSPGSKTWLRVLIYATNPAAISAAWVTPASIGLGLGLALGLFLAAAFGSLPDRIRRRPALRGA